MFIVIYKCSECSLTWEEDEDNESDDGSILTDSVDTQVDTGENHTNNQPNQTNSDHSLSGLELIWKEGVELVKLLRLQSTAEWQFLFHIIN